MTGLDLDSLLSPSRVAVIGATTKDSGLGRRVLRHLEEASFAGAVEIGDPRSVLREPADVAVVAVPSAHVQSVLDRLEGRARHAVVMSSGFEESGQAALRAPEGTALIGPNSVGLYQADARLVLTFAKAFDDLVDCAQGSGAFLISQSGAFGVRIARAARAAGFPLDGFVGTGNETATSAVDFARALLASAAHRPRVLMLYLEAIRDVDGLLEMLSEARAAGIAVVVLYGGRTAAGATAAASHTSALSTDFEVLAEALRWLGVRLVDSDRELLVAARALAEAGPASGARVAIVTGSGGAGVVAADAVAERGLSVPTLSPDLQGRLRALLPEFATAANPVDVTAQVVADASTVAAVCRAIADSGEVDTILAIGRSDYAQHLVGSAVPVVVGLLDGLAAVVGGAGVTVAGDLDSATMSVAAIAGGDLAPPRSLTVRRAAERTHGVTLSAAQSMSIFEDAGIPVAPWFAATSVSDAASGAARLGFPVVVKTDGDAAEHKALAGGVRLDIGEDRITDAASQLLESCGSILVAAQLRPSLELFVGVRADDRFGLLVTTGLGGSHVELLGRTVTVPAGTPTEHLASRLRAEVFSRGGARYDGLADDVALIAERMVGVALEGYALVEANPIALVDGTLLALDARVVAHHD